MKYIFTEEQLLILISFGGMKKFPFFGQPKEIQNSEIIQTITQLYQMNCLVDEEGKMVPAPQFREMLDAIGHTETFLSLWFSVSEAAQHLVCSAGRDSVVILEKENPTGKPVFKLWREQPAVYLHDLFESGLLPKRLMKDRSEAESLEEMAFAENPPEPETLTILVRAERIEAGTGNQDSVIEVTDSAIFTWIHAIREGEEFYHLYSEEELAKLLLEEMRK